MSFTIQAPYQPAGDQPHAIAQLIEGIKKNEKSQTLLGVTGSGKTFTIANVIDSVQKPTLVITHNKTLVAQLYGEFKQFFPNNAVGYFVSYYDYYQPEAYLPVSNTYIEKDLSINEEIDKLRLQATHELLSGRKDIIIVASVSCIYGMGNPIEFAKGIIRIEVGQTYSLQQFLRDLVGILYTRSTLQFKRGQFRVKGDHVDIHVPYLDRGYRIMFFDQTIEQIDVIDIETGKRVTKEPAIAIFPANLYVPPKNMLGQIIREIQDELATQIAYFKSINKPLEAKRIQDRVEYDIEMIRELGYCNGIENYSRFFDRRQPTTRPFCLLDYFPKDFLCIIDESHQTIPQIAGMYGGDRSRKMVLVEHGFRLPSALDNRPLNFQEFEAMIGQTIFVSATPAHYELEQSEGVIIEQIVRPTGLLDPPISVRPSLHQIDNLVTEIKKRIQHDERVLVTTLTKKMAEELTKYLAKLAISCQYIHSDVDTLDRVEILRKLRLGDIDVVIGVNLLREGLDLPEVSLVAILDADKEGFLRDERSLTQIAGRAARNINGLVIFYADRITNSMQKTMDETQRRREKQLLYNQQHHIKPLSVKKTKEQIMLQTSVIDFYTNKVAESPSETWNGNIPSFEDSLKDIEKAIRQVTKLMKEAVKKMDFLEAATLRDRLYAIQKIKEEKLKHSSSS